jgi:CYTH domain-containing protein
MQEIERKWLLKEIPEECRSQAPIHYERHFLFAKDGVETRIQKKGDKYEFERKVETNELTRNGVKFEITEVEFNLLKKLSIASLERQSYMLTENGHEISIKEYLGRHTGLIRAEVEFESEQGANDYQVPSWFGIEITDTPLGKDKKLAFLSAEQFKSLLNHF